MVFLTGGIYNMYTNYHGKECKGHPFEDNNVNQADEEDCGYILRFALKNKRSNKDEITVLLILHLISVVLVIFFFHFMRYKFRKADKIVDDATITPSDFTLELNGVDPSMSDEAIIDWLTAFGNEKHPVNVVKINRAYSIKDYVRNTKIREMLIEKKVKHANNQAKLYIISVKLKELEDYFEDFKTKNVSPTTVVYAVFETAAGKKL